MDIGLSLKWLAPDDPGDQLVAMAMTAESLGFHSIWVSEHIAIPLHIETKDPYEDEGRLTFTPETAHGEAMVLLAFIAGATKQLRLGTYVIPAINRDPLTLAKQAATVDAISGGRLELGIGAGYLPEEAAVLGRPADHRHARLDEMVDILRKAWSNPSFEHHGRFWDIPPVAVRPGPAQERLPVWIGGRGPSVLRTVRERGDGLLTPKATPQSVADMRAQLPPERRVSAGFHLDTSDSWELLRRAVAFRDSGADILILHAGEDVASVVPAIERFARDVAPHL